MEIHMKKISLVLGLLAAGITSAYAQSSVTIGGIVDAAFQHKTNAGATAATLGDPWRHVTKPVELQRG
jgi:predicted porin